MPSLTVGPPLLLRQSSFGDGWLRRRPRSGRTGFPHPAIDEQWLAVVEHVVLSDRPAFDLPVGMNAEPDEMLVAGMTEDRECLLVLDAEECQHGQVDTENEGAGEC